ncbi:DUF4062 domain-containing protein [Planococcus sp. CAU13]|uniref:WD40 domain-containing protein n=1 Tax=Planococcus sp. CAU13 TaxID=1541197 RepID=UPI00052FFF28|nr:AAA family ATPase [Planococcus sp. CAU13]
MPRSSKIFRIFVSSTFSDLKHERTVLQRHVFPELQRLCESYGAKFQAIDLRWGVSEEAQLDHKTLEICLNELQRCKELSPRPNFLILLGNRYGWRPIPAEITKHEFDKIIHYYKSIDLEGYHLLQEWYKEDYNRLPISYCLQPRQGKYSDFNEWNIIEMSLRLLFDHAISSLSLQESEVGRYLISATEHEIQAGAFRQEDAKDHVFAFFREIRNLSSDFLEADFQDITSDGKLDIFAERQLDQLKEKIRSFLPGENIKQYSVNWNGTDIDTSYLISFCQDVINQLKPVIEKECLTIEEKSIREVEKERHQKFGFERARNFIGRDNLFSQIEEAIPKADSPLVIFGESGTGKTAFMAELYNRLNSKHSQGIVVQRFIGASAFGTNIKELLESVLIELTPDQEKEIFALTEIDEILQLMIEAFNNASKEKPYYLLIDGVDHLSDNHLFPKWFSVKLPEHVHCIITVAVDRPAFSLIEGLVPKGNLFHIGPLEVNEGRKLLEEWLTEQSRTLQADQFQVVMEAFEKCPLPLFLKLAFEESKLWKSYTKEVVIQPSISELIGQFLKRISDNSNHGFQLVSHVLGFIAASKNGLEETELLELLSDTEEVMNDFRKRAKHEFMENHLPPVIWVRLLNDIEPYLIEKMENGSLVYSFYHRQLESRVKESYLTVDFHQRLADYFDRKPIFLDEQQTLPHRRKAIEMPFQLYQLKNAERFESLLLNLDFIQGKIASLLSQDLLNDFFLLKQLMKEQGLAVERVQDIERFCRVRHTLLLQHPNRLKLFALQMPHSSFAFLEATRWHEERGVPYLKSYESSSYENRLIHAFDSGDKESLICRFHPNKEHLLVMSDDVVKIWDIQTGEEVYQFHPQIGNLIDLDLAYDSFIGAIIGANGLRIFDLNSYEVQCEQQFKKNPLHTSLHPKRNYVAVGDEEGTIWLINFKNGQKKYIPSKGRSVVKLQWHPTKLLLAIWYSNERIHLWDAEKNSDTQVLYSEYQNATPAIHTAKFRSLSFNHESDLLYASQDHGLTVWDTALGIRVNNTVSLPKGNHLIKGNLVFSVFYDHHLKVWDIEGYTHYLEDHQHFQLHQYADVYNGLLVVMTLNGRILIWDLTEISINHEEMKIKMLNESIGWVVTPVVSGIFNDVAPNLIDWLFRSSLSKSISERTQNSINFWDYKVSSVNISSKFNYITSGHLGGFLQISDINKNTVTQFRPYKTGPIIYVDWSYDDALVFYGTTQKAWVMDSKGKLKMTIKRDGGILSGSWSSTKKQLLLLDCEGTVELIDFDENWNQRWPLDVEGTSHITASWSNSGRYFTICNRHVFCVFEVLRNSNPKLILQGKSTSLIHSVTWSPDDTWMTIIGTNYECVLVNSSTTDIQSKFKIIDERELKTHHNYYKQVLTSPVSRIQFLEDLLLEQGNTSDLEQYIRMFPFQLLVSWNEEQNKIAFSYGVWVTVLMLEQPARSVDGYVVEGVYGLRWENDELYVLTGDKIREKRYLLVT